MERIRGFVQRFGGGGEDAAGLRESTEEILAKLPLTKAFLDELPRAPLLTTASENDTLALEARALLAALNTHLDTHATAATALHTHVAHLSTLAAGLGAADAHAARLHVQLQELTALVDAAAAAAPQGEDEFEAWARARREQVALKRRGWQDELARFEREREGAAGLEDFLGGGEAGAAAGSGPKVKLGPRQKKQKQKQRMAVMADEDIDDEEEIKKWY